MRPVAFRLLNLAVFLGVLYGNFVAASGGLSGRNIGEIANAYPSRFLPANWVFGIWSVIYAGLMLCLACQLWPGARGRRAVERLGPWWTIVGALNVGWIVLFSYARYLEAMILMLAFLGVLIAVGEVLRRAPEPDRWERLCLIVPHDLYLAWISVAVIANTFQVAHVVGFGGFGIPERLWALAMMGIATALGWWMAWARRNLTFPFTVAWALAGIAARYTEDPAVVWFGGPGAIGGIVIGSALWFVATRRAMLAGAPGAHGTPPA
ncbi:MAG: tryptophan-rich sensory protein [Gemmatimonadetes bacterium]|nr:tryptophan-rich sensory protein [Gemmatimonadota bacterium]